MVDEKEVKITKKNVNLIEKEDIVIVRTTLDKINGAMPTPSAFKFAKENGRKYEGGGMSIFDKDDEDAYIDAFIEGRAVEFYLYDETKITTHYGGKVEIRYCITDEFLEEEEITINDMRDFVAEYLLSIGDVILVKPQKNARKTIGRNLWKKFGKKTPEIAEEFDEHIQNFADKHGLSKEEIIELMIGFIDYAFDKEGDIEKIFTAIVNEDFHEALCYLSDYILIANWYDKEDLENVIDKELDEEEYRKIIEEWNDDGLHDEVNEVIRDFINARGGM